MTHTLEVAQIARIIARALRLNEDLTEAGALGHDLGHTPFGHAGERVMQKCFSADFSHSDQSLRVVEKLENNGDGLNLTFEVRDAIKCHNGETLASTLEGVIVKFADRIAYINHDIDDALRGGILSFSDLPKDITEILGDTHSKRINTMVSSIIYASENMNSIQMEPHVWDAMMNMRSFLFDAVYTNPVAKSEEKKAMLMLEGLYDYFVNNPERMPEFFLKIADRDGLQRAVCDYVSGMTDRYAIDTFKKIYIPLSWKAEGE
jgi:dGTPase